MGKMFQKLKVGDDFQDVYSFLGTYAPYDDYVVRLTVTSLAGGVPKHRDILRGWIDSTNKEKSQEDRDRLVQAAIKELPDISEEKEARSWVGFKSALVDGKPSLFIEGRQVKAMLKEAANIIKKVVPVPKHKGAPDGKGITNFKSKLADHVFVPQGPIYLNRSEPDVSEERPVHAMTAQGPRTSLKRVDIVEDVTIEFPLRRLDNGNVPEISLMAVLEYAQHIGLGADRSQGKGSFSNVQVRKVREAVHADWG